MKPNTAYKKIQNFEFSQYSWKLWNIHNIPAVSVLEVHCHPLRICDSEYFCKKKNPTERSAQFPKVERVFHPHKHILVPREVWGNYIE